MSDYPREFDEELKEEVRYRDGLRCRNCGFSQSENVSVYGKKLEVHHVDEDKSHNEKSNLVSLCSRCHSGIHSAGSGEAVLSNID